MLGFGRATQGLIGVDITSATVKLLELERHSDHWRVASWAVRPLVDRAVVERRIRDVDQVVMALSRAIDHAGPRARRAVVAVPTGAVITKVLSMPVSFDDNDIAQRIAMESDKHIPFPFNEVTLDFQRLGVNARYDDQQDILLVACRRQDMQQLTDVLEQVGLEPAVVDVEMFAMERATRYLLSRISHHPDRGSALIDIGASMTAFHIVHRGRIVHTRDNVMGGRQLTDEIRQHYSLTFDDAGRAKKTGDLPDYRQRILHPFRESLVQQIMRSLKLYYTTAGACDIERLILAGGSSVIEGLAERLAEESRLEVVPANPFATMRIGSGIDNASLALDAPAMMTACGLAMRSLS
ncbi:type IV pilus assembly protein PilM [Kushneria phyllosphaerae]|uniref:Cell division protein FtsA n=1 Tax=Kushneria phyllosphaerae TaxID=2100822 RepID=A0A2R8CMU5_9GAMM|nr:type IV pilus assembly protein PilM [Kushneria phyllosphaerae]SPJ34221.1 Cell division protein FtsA [Kushneria phyllosphaerae]